MTKTGRTQDPERRDAGAPTRGVIRRDSVRVVAQPALVDCSSKQGASITVIPLIDGDVVAGFEVRCSCGQSTLIECVYQPKDNR